MTGKPPAAREESPKRARVIYTLAPHLLSPALVRLAFDKFRRLRGRECVLQLVEDLACVPETIELFAREVDASPDLERLTIVFDSANARAFASALDGASRARVCASPTLEDAVGSREPNTRIRHDSWLEEADAPHIHVVHVDLGRPEATWLSELRRPDVEAAALVLPDDRDLSQELVDVLARQLVACVQLHTVILVHPSPFVGYAASILLRRIPNVFFASCRSEAEILRAVTRR